MSGDSELKLRQYQLDAIHETRISMACGLKRIIISSPTGSGKTEIGMEIIKSARLKHKRVAFLANRIHLIEQTSRRFSKSNIPHGIIQGENTRATFEHVLIASIQTVAKRGLPEVDLLVIDEAHAVAGSKGFRNVIESAKCPVVGLSATPYSKGLGKRYESLGGPLFESMVVASTISDLIKSGYLVDCDIYAPSEPDMSEVKQVRNKFGEVDYSDMDIGKAVDKPELIGDIVTHWFKLAQNTPTVCFASNIAHSRHIVEQFQRAGVSAEHIDCYTDDKERIAVLKRIETGETMVISNVGILAEGWDFPACKTLILARPTKSLIRYIQMAGRVLRPHETKEKALILDHSGTVTRLGFPTDDFEMTLDDGNPQSSSSYESKKEEKLPKACPVCSYLKPAWVHICPSCGFEPKKQPSIKTVDGELVLLKGIQNKKIGKQSFYSQLIHVAQEKGYQDGWVSHKYREYFGVWPKGLKYESKPPSTEVKDYLKYLQIKYAKSKAKYGT